MSVSLDSRLRDALPSILTRSRHSEIWGVDLKHAERPILDIILDKFLRCHSAIPALQVPRARASLEKSLEWRRICDPRSRLSGAEPILSDLDLCHITSHGGQYVLWVSINELPIKGYSAIHHLASYSRLVDLGLAVMEKLSMILLQSVACTPSCGYSASCVVDFKKHPIRNTEQSQSAFQGQLRMALQELVTSIRYHYPNILEKAYIINPRDEYLASLDIDDSLLRNTTLLKNPESLAQYLGSSIPPYYGGTGESFADSDLLYTHYPTKDTAEKISLETPETDTAASTDTETSRVQDESAASSTILSSGGPEKGLETEETKLRLIYSDTIGPPSIILDPDDLETAEDLCPDKMGARLAFADSDTIVKFGHSVRLAEAEALHLACTRTTVATPRLLSAYILDGVGYILMSYEPGEPLEHYWDRVSKSEQDRVLKQLRDYVRQMRAIPGDFISGVDRSRCRDGIFEAGYGDYTKYSYGPYSSEESFNEGIVQALRDRLPPKVLKQENDVESHFFNREYTLYQTVRGLKNHKIVFTHGDLHSGNIVVRADGTVVLLDWGLAGFWPDYWEFYRAMHSAHWRASWDRMIERFIPPAYVEYSVISRVFAFAWN
ncbi:protein kinase-like protein [Aspergillus candidus]|uniref:Protein kinase-like protein n=1 Tax=Aspergillus candidus TaxID=41067 RepID=A0A2I2FLM7_ASPCN|nr:protein kinase-like protein [Aspergillus candidus]PLB41523.1 protein kinase-like protein [Aspergillus candidus]